MTRIINTVSSVGSPTVWWATLYVLARLNGRIFRHCCWSPRWHKTKHTRWIWTTSLCLAHVCSTQNIWPSWGWFILHVYSIM